MDQQEEPGVTMHTIICEHGNEPSACIQCLGKEEDKVQLTGSRAKIVVVDDIVEEPRLCVDCEHIATNGMNDWKTFRCMAPQNEDGPNLVKGGKLYRFEFCLEARESELLRIDSTLTEQIRCGPAGAWFKLYDKTVNLAMPSGGFRNQANPQKMQIYSDTVKAQDFGAQDLNNLANAAADRLAALKNKKKNQTPAKSVTQDDLNNL